MRPLVEIPDSSEEHQDLIGLLLASGIRYQERQSTFFMPATVWVNEDDHAKALEIALSVAARHAKQTKAEWTRQWNERYRGSYLRWLIANFHKPANLLRLVLLVAMVGVFVIYPLLYIARRML